MKESSGCSAGIGIFDFFRGKNIFITGATGLVGKVLVEKLIRSTLVGKIYLLIKANNQDAAFQRFTKEIMFSELLKNVREKHGKNYEEFVKNKLIPVAGDINKPNLGMDSENVILDSIKNEVNLIIASAASTNMYERYDLILETNVNGPQRLMNFAKTCKNLKLFTHISTAYVNGSREGVILETSIGNENEKNKKILFVNPDEEMDMASKLAAAASAHLNTTLKRLGQQRAEYFGLSNAYQLSKVMGEMRVVQSAANSNIPLLIMRPSIVESTYADPFPGWIQGNRMFDPVLFSYAKGQLPAYFANPDVYLDIIPVDMVAAATIAAIAKHGEAQADIISRQQQEVNVYHVSSSSVNPVSFSDIFELLYEYFNEKPLLDGSSSAANVGRIKFFSDFSDFSKYTKEQLLQATIINDDHVKAQNQCRARAAYAQQLCKIYEFAGFLYSRFDTGNTLKLLSAMSEEEKQEFQIDATKIDWRKYFLDIHIPGLKKHVINV